MSANPQPILESALTLRDCLAAKYALPHHVLLWEVRNSTGFDSSRSADAIAITLYVSRGRAITGFEIKEHRSDWLAELKKPDKAEAIAQFCDFFFVVSPQSDVVKPDEIPHPWGWLAFTGKMLKVAKKPQKLDPIPLDRAMLCSLIYSTMGRFREETKASFEEQVKDRVTEEHRWLAQREEHARNRLQELEDKIDSFENASGVSLRYKHTEDMPKIGAAVRTVLDGKDGLHEHIGTLRWMSERIETMHKQIVREIAELESRTAKK